MLHPVSERIFITAILAVIYCVGAFLYWAIYEIRYDHVFPWGTIRLFGSVAIIVVFLLWVVF